MPGINITVKNKIARADGAHYVCGNSDYVANFKFDSEWDEYETKTARFSYNGSYVDVVFDGDQCPVPIISDTYFFLMGVYAGNLHTTTPARVPCKKSILCGGGSPAGPAPDVYNQIMEQLNDLNELSEEELAEAVEAYFAENPVADDAYDTNRYDPEQIQVIRYMPSIPEAMTASIVPSLLGSPVTEISEDAATVPSATSSTVYALGFVVRQLAMLLTKNKGSLQGVAETLDKVFVDFLKLVDGGYITLPFYIHFGLNSEGEIIPNNYISISRGNTAYIVRVSCRDEGTKNYSYYLCYYYDEGAAPASATGRVGFSALQPYKWLQHAFYSTADDGKILTLDNGNVVFKSPADVVPIPSSDSEKRWTKIIDTEVTEETSAFTVDGLDNYTEFYAKWSALKNKSDATASGLVLKINDAEIAAAAVPTAATSGTGLYGWTKVEYNGLAWEVQKSQGAISATNTTFSAAQTPYNLVDGVGAATKISLAVGNASLYAVIGGKLEVWGR